MSTDDRDERPGNAAPDPTRIDSMAELATALAELKAARSYNDLTSAADDLTPAAARTATAVQDWTPEPLSRGTVSDWISGRGKPTRSKLLTFLTVCGVPAAQIPEWLAALDRVRRERDTDRVEDGPPNEGGSTTFEGRGGSRRPSMLLIVAAAVGVTLAVLLVAVVPRRQDPTGATASTPVPTVVGTGVAARLTAPVDGTMTAGHSGARTISLWSFASTSSGCDISACKPGTDEIGTVALPADVVVMCVTTGQQIRNGAVGDPGFYRDDRWLQVDPTQNFGQSGQGRALWLSNVWYLRDRLPNQLPHC